MKKVFVLSLLLVAHVLVVHADDYTYPFLTFETADGNVVSVPVSSLTMTIADGTLTAGSQTFTLSNLNKMYFSTSDVTGIDEPTADADSEIEVFTLDGLALGKYKRMTDATATLKRGVYLVKSKRKNIKIAVK